MQLAFDAARKEMNAGNGGPFGAVVVKDDEVIGQSGNRVYAENDPTAHGEIMAIRDACQTLGSRKLEGCTLYSTCEPCPMCFSAIYFSGIQKVYFAAYHSDAGRIAGFGMEALYTELTKPIEARELTHIQLARTEGIELLEEWTKE